MVLLVVEVEGVATRKYLRPYRSVLTVVQLQPQRAPFACHPAALAAGADPRPRASSGGVSQSQRVTFEL